MHTIPIAGQNIRIAAPYSNGKEVAVFAHDNPHGNALLDVIQTHLRQVYPDWEYSSVQEGKFHVYTTAEIGISTSDGPRKTPIESLTHTLNILSRRFPDTNSLKLPLPTEDVSLTMHPEQRKRRTPHV